MPQKTGIYQTDGSVLDIGDVGATPTTKFLRGDGSFAAPTGIPPSGPAGGVLSGTYPDPGFAVDMATEAELTAGLATKQPLDAELSAIAGLVSAADRVPYFTGLGTASLAVLTSFGRSVVAAIDAAAARTVLGLGNLSTLNTVGTTQIDNAAVTMAKVEDIAQNTVIGRVAAGSGPPIPLSATQLTTIPNAMVGDSGAGGTKGSVPAPGAGDAAAGKYLKADGVWTVPPAGGGTPATTVTSEETFGIADAVGVSTNYAREDHTHGSPAAPTAASVGADLAGSAAAAQAASQPLDADLTAIAALTSAADRVPYATGAGAWALAVLTSVGRNLVAAVDAAAMRVVLGLGTLATQDGTFSGTSSGTNTGDQTSVSGNAGTATALQTPRAINGVNFDGTAPITVAAAGSTLTGTTIAAGMLGTTGSTACAGNDARLSDSRAPSGAASGDLGGTYPSPTVTQARGLRETGTPTTLTMGAVTDGQYLRRSGATVVGDTPAGAGALALSQKAPSSAVTVTAGYSAYIAEQYECVSGVETEIGVGATLEIG